MWGCLHEYSILLNTHCALKLALLAAVMSLPSLLAMSHSQLQWAVFISSPRSTRVVEVRRRRQMLLTTTTTTAALTILAASMHSTSHSASFISGSRTTSLLSLDKLLPFNDHRRVSGSSWRVSLDQLTRVLDFLSHLRKDIDCAQCDFFWGYSIFD